MSVRFITTDLLEELSVEQQQLLAGGQAEADADEADTDEPASSDKRIGRPRRYKINSDSIVTVRKLD